jgi:hypothetical protein
MESKRRADNTYPLALRVTSDRRSKYLYLNIYILRGQWDEVNQRVRKNHPNASHINAFIQEKLLDAQKVYLNQEIRKKSITPAELKKRIKHKRTGITFFSYAQEYLNNLFDAGKM